MRRRVGEVTRGNCDQSSDSSDGDMFGDGDTAVVATARDQEGVKRRGVRRINGRVGRQIYHSYLYHSYFQQGKLKYHESTTVRNSG